MMERLRIGTAVMASQSEFALLASMTIRDSRHCLRRSITRHLAGL
jgi:hypothetical protein